ncbi:hypothetical protein QT969_20810 [Rhodococcus sp. CSLK01-03]|uniref:Uncharacterized protein n=1 Tax=Rhodococcus indonesiensis TaxID=3055869 RepID=A0ABT7RSV5_9NOCA|nr:hypothetical protein [Rhodococcus indonesiensis]MDM7490732.1 hypothetical protein [Rhodococcus indonesiensis]
MLRQRHHRHPLTPKLHSIPKGIAMTNKTAAQQYPQSSRLYLADLLTEAAGPDLDVSLDDPLADDSLSVDYRQRVADEREQLIIELRRRLAGLRQHIDHRDEVHRNRAGLAETRAALEQQREQERAETERRRRLEQQMLDRARRQAEQLGLILEPCRVPHVGPTLDLGRGTTAEQTETIRWRITAPLDHRLAAGRDDLMPTIDRRRAELFRSGMRSTCEKMAELHARYRAATPEDSETTDAKPERRGLFGGRR